MARKNARGLELSFRRLDKGQTRGRWMTRVGGKPRYFGYGNGVTDRDSYNAALVQYRVWQAQQVEQNETERRGLTPELVAYEKSMQAWGRQITEIGDRTKAQKGGAEPVKVGVLLDEFLADQGKRNQARKYVEERRAGEDVKETPKQNLSDYRYVAIKRDVRHLRGGVGDDWWNGKEETAAALLRKWRDICERLLFDRAIKENSFNDRMKIARQFVGWCEQNYKLDRLPRAMLKLVAKYKYEPSAKAVPVETIKALWKKAGDRERVFIALGLNLGYYAKVISDLTADMIQGGYVAHSRAKTGVKVRYKLWPMTAELLEKTRMDGGSGRVFRGKNGKPLVWFPEGSESRVDVVRNDFYRLCQRAKVKGYSFSNLRDTSTTAVENFDRSLSDLFDCHKDQRMARYYIDGEMVDTSALDKAIDHLENFYGLSLDMKDGPPQAASQQQPEAA